MDKKLELSTLFGIVVTLGLIGSAIGFGGEGQFLSFVDVPSFMIVVGGTFFISCASFSIHDTMKALADSTQTLFYTTGNKKEIVTKCLLIANHSKKEGILSIQKISDQYRNMHSFFKKYLGLVMDGLHAPDAEKILMQEIMSIRERHRKAVEVLRKAAEVSPAMGLVGTLIGLVQMLGNMNDPSKIGPSMALALLTTLYGAVTAYVILIPLANKLEKNSREEIELLKIYAEVIVAIAKHDGPVKLEMRLNANLNPEERVSVYF